MQVLRHNEVPRRSLGDEQRVDYQADHLKVVLTHIPSGHSQDWHSHKELYDATWVVGGEVMAKDLRDGRVHEVRLVAGDFVVFEPGFAHTLTNPSLEPATTLTMKLQRPSESSPEAFAALCRTDWRPANVDP